MGSPRRSSALEILVLGDLQVRRDGRSLALPPSRKTRALLGYLAVLGRPQSRQRLCDLLWDGPGDPRGALRWGLAKLRPILGEGRFSADKDSVAVALTEGELDLAVVRAVVAVGVREAALEALRRAAALFRGELLEGLDLPDDFRFHEWCIAERERARRLRLAILDALVERLEGEAEDALSYARARVEVDPFAERGHVAVVRLLGRLGRRREAIEQYDACRHILATALGARPSGEMERARLEAARSAPAEPVGSTGAAAMRTPAPPPRLAAPAGRLPATSHATPLVGRERERAEIARLAGAVKASRRCHGILVVGEPGIGKSRLLEEVAAQVVETAGGLIVNGRSYEAEMLRPYGPWLDALRSAPLATLSEVQRSELAPLLPELGSPPPGLLGDQARLFDGVVCALAAFAEPGLLAILLDDAHWIDEPSAALLHYAVRALDGAPVLVVCAVRPGELADNPAALRVTRSLARAERMARLELGPLGAEDIRALVGRVAPNLDAARVFTESDGNPLFALEVARALRDGAETGTLEGLLSERLARVGGRARDVVPWAAALGRSFPVERLLRVSGVPSMELLSSVEELERRGILRPSAEGAYDFTHDLVRRAAYQALSDPRRQLLHREIARALAPLPDPDGALAGEIARHAALGDDAELAATASVFAGARAVRLWALKEGDDIAVRGIRFAERLPAAKRIPLTLGLLRVRVDASRRTGGDPDLLPRIQAVIDEAEREGLAAEVAAGHTVLTQAHYANRDLAHTAEATARSLEALRAVDPAAAADAMAEVGGCLAILEREIPRARVLLEETGRVGMVSGRAAVFHAFGLGIIQELEGAPEEGASTLERALRLAGESAPWEELQLLGRLAFIDLELGRPGRASDRVERMREAAPKQGDAGDVLFANALALVVRRAFGEAVPDEEIEAPLARLESDARLRFAQVACALAEQDLAAGRVETARGRLERARSAAEAVPRPSVSALVRALLARAALKSGDAAAAAEEMQAARQIIERSGPAGRAARLLDEIARELDLHDPSAAAAPP